MITYEPFYATLKAKNMSEYKLVKEHGFSPNIFFRMKHGENISTKTVNSLCEILNCTVSDIIIYKKDSAIKNVDTGSKR